MTLRLPALLLFLVTFHLSARADHVLLRDGRALFNVRLVDNISTSARPLKIHYGNNSFLYDFQRDLPVWRGNEVSGQFNVADFVKTTRELKGKKDMRAFMLARQWSSYYDPPPEPFTMPTPEPTPVITPVPRETPLPVNVASTSLPLEERLPRQLNMFMEEQQKLAAEIRTSVTLGKLTDPQATQVRLQWLQAQRQVLDQYYPRDAESVRDAKAQWEIQSNEVKGMGKFRFED